MVVRAARLESECAAYPATTPSIAYRPEKASHFARGPPRSSTVAATRPVMAAARYRR